MKLIFAGSPEVAVPTLAALVAAGHDIVLVITRPDAPSGRKRVLTPTPIATWAVEHGIPVLKPERFDDEVLEAIAASDAELGVVVAYGGLIPQAGLDALAHGWINLHFSALPDLRGAAPVQRALMRGDTTIGTSVFQLVAQLDAGAVWSLDTHDIGVDETADELLHRLADLGASQVCGVVTLIDGGHDQPEDQHGEITHAAKLFIADGEFVASESGRAAYARFRGVTSEPGMWFMDGETRVKIHEARLSALSAAPGDIVLDNNRAYLGTASVALELLRVQPAGKNAMNAADWARGRKH